MAGSKMYQNIEANREASRKKKADVEDMKAVPQLMQTQDQIGTQLVGLPLIELPRQRNMQAVMYRIYFQQIHDFIPAVFSAS